MDNPRCTSKGNLHWPLHEILFLTLSAIVSLGNTFKDIYEFGIGKLDWLRNYFPFQNGILSHDTLEGVFASVNREEFSTCFSEWVDTFQRNADKEVIKIDGKTAQDSANPAKGQSALHRVSAFASQAGLGLGQLANDQKSNEITSQTRYYISNSKSDAEAFDQKIRSRWAMEKNIHWSLAGIFGEDAQNQGLKVIKQCSERNCQNGSSDSAPFYQTKQKSRTWPLQIKSVNAIALI